MTMRVAKLDQRSTDRLFHDVFQQWSDLFVFTLGFFSSVVHKNNEAESKFLEAIAWEAVSRGLLKGPKFTMGNFNRGSFSEGDEEDVCGEFDCGSFKPTAEDKFVELFTDSDRWAEREQNRRAQKLQRTGRNRDI